MSEAACVNAPTEWFYDTTLYRTAIRAFCDHCPIREQCLQDCLEAEEMPIDGKKFRSGIFGGLSPSGRNRLMGTQYDVISDDWMEKSDNRNSN